MALDGLERIEQDLFQIRHKIIANEKIRKLVYYSGKNALSQANVEVNLTKEHIFVTPVFDTTKEPFNKMTFISIILPNTEWDDEMSSHLATIRINVFSKIENWELDNDSIRTLQITSEIIRDLSDIKLKSSHKLFYLSSDLTTLNDLYAGYTILFGIQDGGGEDAELY